MDRSRCQARARAGNLKLTHYRKTGEDVKATFSSSDLVGDKTVFNIAFNRYRLIAWIAFRAHRIFIRGIMTHKQYNKGEWKK